MNRVISLDYLRGLCAFLIMIYHYLHFVGIEFDSSHFLGRIGLYGVSIFYILSGLTLYLVYHERFDIRNFYIRRMFRIYPLLWIAITLSVIVLSLNPSIKTLFLNYTGLFGVFRWWRYIGTGVWSIGNELFFYLAFPIFLLPVKKISYWPLIIAPLIYGVYLWFAFSRLTPGASLAEQWKDYINPFNQVGLFFTGFLIGYLFKDVEIKKGWAAFLCLAGVILFIVVPAEGNAINIATGWKRMIFTFVSAMICFSFFKLNLQIPIIHQPLKVLGEASYSVYLLHPIVWFTLAKIEWPIDPAVRIVISTSVVLLVSYLVYMWFEKPWIRLGKRLSSF